MNVGDLLLCRDDRHGCQGLWEVRTVRRGAVGHEDMVELLNLLERPSSPTVSQHGPTTWVPAVLLQGISTYARRTAQQGNQPGQPDHGHWTQDALDAQHGMQDVDAFMRALKLPAQKASET